MKITVTESKDSNGNPILIYNTEEVMNKKNTNDFLFDTMLEQLRESNLINKNLIDTFWLLDSVKFESFFHQSVNEKSKLFLKYRPSDINNDISSDELLKNSSKELKEAFIQSFVNSLYGENDKKILKNNLDKALDSFSTIFNKEILPLLLWQLDFKEQSLKLLEKFSCSFTVEEYDYIYDKFSKDFRRNELPLSIVEKDNILNEEKLDFIQIQKNYYTFKKLSNSLVEKKSVKSSKI